MSTDFRKAERAQPKVGRNFSLLAGAFALLLSLNVAVGDAAAVTKANDPPIYNPASKSYFQLLTTTGGQGYWGSALEQARAQVFKGVRGRLAVVDTSETHEFIMKQFDMSNPIWIGLRYWCSFRMLEWVGLRPYSPTDPGHFHQWHPQWARHGQGCVPGSSGPRAYMGVYYQPLGKQTARWQAARAGKGFSLYLVEFPTGEK
ncbi:C-type lectin domain-containing protein [Pelagibius sp.]|uniref:C-type lectin domain-containing protein n=1 Tax=Pelagibius sp. TaxID=1931238 RepID=UPI00260EB714|nr:C-type lectin domain-containing protein [Pelagibius sp.]